MNTGVFKAMLSRVFLRAYHEAPLGREVSLEGPGIYVPRGVFNPLPAASSLLLARTMRPRGRVLDMGTGTGVLAMLASRMMGVELAVGYDESMLAVAAARLNARINGLEEKTIFTCSWSRVLSLAPFDTVVVNPPYLPLEPRDPLDRLWSGGRDLRITIRMILRSLDVLRRKGRIYVVLSNLAPWREIVALAKAHGAYMQLCASKPVFPDIIMVICGLKA